MGDTFDVIVAAYPSAGPAERDFDALVRLVKDKTVRSEGVILVSHDLDGQVRVTQTDDHLGRKGMGWGGGAGLVVGLFSPPMLASIVVGAAAGGLAGTPSPATCRTSSAAWCRASTGGPTPSRPSSASPRPAPRA